MSTPDPEAALGLAPEEVVIMSYLVAGMLCRLAAGLALGLQAGGPTPAAEEADAVKVLTAEARALLAEVAAVLDGGGSGDGAWQAAALEAGVREFAGARSLKLGVVAQPLRAALTGSLASPGLFEVMEVLGRDEVLGRLQDAANGTGGN